MSGLQWDKSFTDDRVQDRVYRIAKFLFFGLKEYLPCVVKGPIKLIGNREQGSVELLGSFKITDHDFAFTCDGGMASGRSLKLGRTGVCAVDIAFQATVIQPTIRTLPFRMLRRSLARSIRYQSFGDETCATSGDGPRH
ncbi:hypothetical protein PCAR4_810086 [Paraburkholderia caribensis]|nr:hypothetical protein PCAR4_810086 [Paraburkholderia caribensis]